LDVGSTEASCIAGHCFAVADGIPQLVTDLAASALRQAAWFDDDSASEWEVERPHGSPSLHRWLLEEKFRRAVAGLRLDGASTLVVCAGSGMDAEFLARAGATVAALDISLGAVRRARERAARHCFDLFPVVGDTKRLPFGDCSVDVVYVHDGLHHLDDPVGGLTEMARVARKAVCINEPAAARVTSLAVRAGLALEREEAGNRVARLDPDTVSTVLRGLDFRIVRCERYGMYYRHEPGLAASVLSRRGFFAAARAGFRIANAAVGRFGNKLTILAVRPGSTHGS
jgi:SAM-dependent methyltransferase